MDQTPFRDRKREHGQTIILVALSMTALLAMAAISIDVVTLYVARSEAQHAAEAAALAGAKAFVTSGYTSGFVANTTLCSGGTGLAELQAQAAAIQNNIAGVVPTIFWAGSSCDLTTYPENPRITIQVQRTGLPLFFAKIWNVAAPTVTATATAEAYNPSGGPAPIQVSGVKPWLVPNCPPSASVGANPNCNTPYFIDQTNAQGKGFGSIANNGAFIGTTITLVLPQQSGDLTGGTNTQLYFYPLAIPISPPTPSCPASSQPSCSLVGNGPFFDNIACANPFQLVAGQPVGGGQTVQIDSRLSSGSGSPSWGQLQSRMDQGTQCLIHASGSSGPITSCSPRQYAQDCFAPQAAGDPILISPGFSQPDPSLLNASYISRSDSVVTVPLFDGSNLCPLGKNQPCTGTANIQGFLQLGITRDEGNGTVEAIILNASGWNLNSTGTAVSGGDVSSIPVRLVRSGG